MWQPVSAIQEQTTTGMMKRIVVLIMAVIIDGIFAIFCLQRIAKLFWILFLQIFFFHKATEITGKIPERFISSHFSSRLSTAFHYGSSLTQALGFTFIDGGNGNPKKTIKLKSW